MRDSLYERDRRIRHLQRGPLIAFGLSMVAGLALAVVYASGGQTQLEGVLLSVCLGGIGSGMVMWAKRFMPEGPEIEPHGRLASTEEERREFAADFGIGEVDERRGLLTKMLLASLGALGLAALFPLRSLGPSPSSAEFKVSKFKPGTDANGQPQYVRLVDTDGLPIRAVGSAGASEGSAGVGDATGDEGFVDAPQEGGIITVFPEGDTGDEFAQTLLIGLDPTRKFTPREGREAWVVENLAAFSKVCTHAGCPVGLYEKTEGTLLCPCHQSTFDVYDACRPVFGPAAVSLPQLPLMFDDDGYLVATGDFSEPPGPGFWDQDRDLGSS